MSVLNFPKIDVVRVDTAKQVDAELHPLRNGLAKNANVVRYGKKWVIKIIYWESCDVMQTAVANARKEWVL